MFVRIQSTTGAAFTSTQYSYDFCGLEALICITTLHTYAFVCSHTFQKYNMLNALYQHASRATSYCIEHGRISFAQEVVLKSPCSQADFTTHSCLAGCCILWVGFFLPFALVLRMLLLMLNTSWVGGDIKTRIKIYQRIRAPYKSPENFCTLWANARICMSVCLCVGADEFVCYR